MNKSWNSGIAKKFLLHEVLCAVVSCLPFALGSTSITSNRVDTLT